MTEENLLDAACRLAYEVAKAGSIDDLPPSMRDFLDVDELPPRALMAAHDAMERRPLLRIRVGSFARETIVGRVGYLWLTRPTGWVAELQGLGAGHLVEKDVMDNSGKDNMDSDNDEETAPVIKPSFSFSDSSTSNEVAASSFSSSMPGSSSSAPGSLAGPNGTSSPESDIKSDFTEHGVVEHDVIEDELSSLRSLVDRLTGERTSLNPSQEPTRVTGAPDSQSVVPVQASLSPARYNPQSSIFDNDEASLKTDLDTARHELSLAKSEISAVRQERDEARRQQSDSLKRQVALERDLATATEERTKALSEINERQAVATNLDEKLRRLRQSAEESDRELAGLRAQLDSLVQERNELREDRTKLKSERDGLLAQLESASGHDIATLVSDHDRMTRELESTNREMSRLVAQVEHYESQLISAATAADAAKTEKIELRSRMSDTELALETTRTQLRVVQSENERLTEEVTEMRSEREILEPQLADLQQNLSSVLQDQAEARLRHDADRAALSEVRVDRDVLASRANELEVAEREAMLRLTVVAAERDQLISVRDELVEERGELRSEIASIAVEKSQLSTALEELEGRIGPLETEVQSERRQRQELANRLLELDDQAAQDASELAEALEENNRLSKELDRLRADKLVANEIRMERDLLENRLHDSEERFSGEAQNLSERVSELTSELDRTESERVRLEVQLEEMRVALAETRTDVADADQQSNRLVVARDTALKELERAKEEIDRLRNAAKAQREIDVVDSDSGSPLWPAAGDSPAPTSAPGAQLPTMPVPVPGRSAFDDEPDDLDTIGDLIAETVRELEPTEQAAPFAPASPLTNPAPLPPPQSLIDRPAEQPDLGLRTSSRRTIEIPEDLIGDEVAVARYVVNCPDVVLLVDGDAVSQIGWPGLSVAERRDALVTYLGDLAANSGAAPDVVFDGRIADEGELPSSRSVRIRLSTPPGQPAAALDELVDAYPEQWPIALVSDDRSLAAKATSRGATVLNNGQLLDLFIGQ